MYIEGIHNFTYKSTSPHKSMKVGLGEPFFIYVFVYVVTPEMIKSKNINLAKTMPQRAVRVDWLICGLIDMRLLCINAILGKNRGIQVYSTRFIHIEHSSRPSLNRLQSLDFLQTTVSGK